VNGVLIDSDILIEVLRARDPDILSAWRDLAASDAAVVYSPVSAAEIWYGARQPEGAAIAGLFSAMTCAPIDAETGRKAGEYLRRYRRSHGVELGDALIAAAAAIHGLRLWTRNRRHFPMKDVRLLR